MSELEDEAKFQEFETKYLSALKEKDDALNQLQQYLAERSNQTKLVEYYQKQAETFQQQLDEQKSLYNKINSELQQTIADKQDLLGIVEKRSSELSNIKGRIEPFQIPF